MAGALQKREKILNTFADKLEASKDEIMAQNTEDINNDEHENNEDNSLPTRLDRWKFMDILADLRSIAKLQDPIRQVNV